MKTNRFASIGISASFFIVTMFFATAAFAGWTCCTPNADGSASSDCGKVSGSSCINGCCSVETKSRNECPAGSTSSSCISCGGNLVSNVCSGGVSTNDSDLCRYAGVNPQSLTLKQGQEFDMVTNAYNPGFFLITGVSAVSTAPTIVSVAPSLRNVCCGWKYGYSNPAIPLHVVALGQGASMIVTTFASDQTKFVCKGASTITVKDIATPLSCIPGAKCVSSTAAFSVGSSVTCSMPKPTNLTLGTPSYELKCTPYAAAVAQRQILLNSATGTFAAFKVATGVTRVDCSFRYCQKATNGVITCSKWTV